MKRTNKAYIALSLVLSALLLGGCGSKESYAAMDSGGSANFAAPAETAAAGNYSNGYGSKDIYSYEYSEAEESEAMAEGSGGESGVVSGAVKKEMLVYSCTMTVDVLDFGTAVDSFRNNLNIFGAFVETENYSDGGSGGRWQYKDSEKWQTYNATVRVPSQNYDAFCDSAAQLGDLRSKNASVQNLSREYYDLASDLEIYEAKETRYIELLSTIQNEEYAVAVEKELTEIQLAISRIKTRMNDIQTDVAYSYVYVTINEVKEYTAEPVKTDTFLQRLGNTVSDAASDFLDVMESLLFIFIYLFPHLVVIGLVVFAVISIIKAVKKRRKAKDEPAPQPAPEPEAKAAEAPEEKIGKPSKTEEKPKDKEKK